MDGDEGTLAEHPRDREGERVGERTAPDLGPAAREAAWGALDRVFLERMARSGPPPIFATISGAHLYGFASRDSDVDLRGVFLHPARAVLGLHPPAETLTIEDKTVCDLDFVAHDLRKFARMLTSHNGYALEQLFSPLVVLTTPAHEELLALGAGCVTRPTARHYTGFLKGRRRRLTEPQPSVKHLLYAFRVVLTGIHLMETGEVIANLPRLNERFRIGEIDALIARKRAGAEAMKVDARELAAQGALLDSLEARLYAAHATSALPDEPRSAAALEDFVVRLRLE